MEASTTTPSNTLFKDRSGWLVFFGIVEILIGSMFALLTVVVMAVLLFAERISGVQAGALNPAGSVAVLGLYGLLSMFFISAGIGTWRGRRWARVLMLVASSLWLVFGLLGAVFLFFLFPVIRESLNSGGTALPDAAKRSIFAMLIFMTLFIYILLPAAFLFFYSRKSVKATFEWKHPHQPSSSRCPMPVVALTAWLVFCAFSSLVGLLFRVQAVFGVVLTGIPAVLLSLVIAALQGWLAWGIHRLKRSAWKGALLFYVVRAASGVVTFYKVPMWQLYEKMGLGQQAQMSVKPLMESMQSWMPLYSMMVQAAFLGFMLYLGRYFRDRRMPDPHPDAG